MIICGTWFCVDNKKAKKKNKPKYKVPPHFQWSEQKRIFHMWSFKKRLLEFESFQFHKLLVFQWVLRKDKLENKIDLNKLLNR